MCNLCDWLLLLDVQEILVFLTINLFQPPTLLCIWMLLLDIYIYIYSDAEVLISLICGLVLFCGPTRDAEDLRKDLHNAGLSPG